MIDLAPEVFGALNTIDGISFSYFYPADWNSLPAGSFYEINNADYAQADGREYLSEIAYQIDIWSDNPSENARIAMLVDVELAGIGLRRETSMDLFETENQLHHRTMRYGCISKQDKTIYQRGG